MTYRERIAYWLVVVCVIYILILLIHLIITKEDDNILSEDIKSLIYSWSSETWFEYNLNNYLESQEKLYL